MHGDSSGNFSSNKVSCVEQKKGKWHIQVIVETATGRLALLIYLHKQGRMTLQWSMPPLHTHTLIFSQSKVDSNMDVGQVANCYLFNVILVVLRHKPFSHKGVQRDLASALDLHWVLACRLMGADTLILLWVFSTLVTGSKQFASRY